MAGAIEKKKNDTRGELESSPATHITARAAVLSDIALSREFANEYLQALCKKFTSSSGDYSLHQICENLAKQRAICYGAEELIGSIAKFDLPSYETVNGALTLTEANTSFFGYVSTDLTETNTITLSNDTNATQTIDGNTFSTYIGNYYLVRSRVSGELEDMSGNLSAYTTPDGGDIVFGNTIAWGSSVAGEEEANTWNYHWAKANVASVAVKNSGSVLELNTITFADHLTQGSNTDYNPSGPGFGQKFWLKRHADHVDTFTITGTTTTASASITGVSEVDLAKVKRGDVISGTGIPDDIVTILAVQTSKSSIRLSDSGTATADGTVTLTVNSVPVGQAAHDIFCQLEVSGEGLVANTSWTPVGDDAGTYAAGSEDDLCVANTTQFKNLLNFFDPNNTAAGKDLIKGSSSAYVSDGKEVNDTTYPYIISNPFFPSLAGTSKAYETKTEGGQTLITGTQPSGLGDKDLWSGRYSRWDKDRKVPAGTPDKEFRWVLDFAEKFYYELPANSVFTCGTQTVPTAHPMPNQIESPLVMPNKNALQIAIDQLMSRTTDIGVEENTPVVPEDDEITYRGGGSGVNLTPGSQTVTLGQYYIVESNNIITSYSVRETQTNTNTSNYTVSYANQLDGPFQCVYNHVQNHLYTNQTANAEIAAVETSLTSLQAIDSFRDPIITGKHSGSGISDSDFDTAVSNAAGAGLKDTRDMQVSFRAAFAASGRVTHPTGAVSAQTLGQGNAVDFRAFSHSGSTANAWAQWVSFTTRWRKFKDSVAERITEIDARIGVPTRTGGGAYPGNPPTGRVSAVPSSNTTNGFVPYGRSIYNSCNHLLGGDVDLLGGIISSIEGLTDLIDMVKTSRNKYEIYSGRDKVY